MYRSLNNIFHPKAIIFLPGPDLSVFISIFRLTLQRIVFPTFICRTHHVFKVFFIPSLKLLRDLRLSQFIDRPEFLPLVRISIPCLVHKSAVSLLQRLPLQRQRHQIPQLAKHVLRRVHPVVILKGGQIDRRSTTVKQCISKCTRQNRWNSTLKEDPDMCASPRP